MGASGGDGEFDRFVESHSRSLLRQAYVLTGDLQEAEDLVQETFVRVWREWPRVSALDSPAGWSRHVLHNLAVSSWRRWRTRRRHAGAREETIAGPGVGHLDIATAIRSLPAKHRQVLVLRAVVGMSSAEIAAELNTTESTVRSWLSRARAEMAGKLGLADSSDVASKGGEERAAR